MPALTITLKMASDAISIADVVFSEASPRQRILAWELNGASWAAPMSLEQYVGRETTLSETPLSANGGTKYLVLYHKDDLERIVSACEVTAKKLLVADAQGSRVVDSYAIASVFTAPRYRGHGMGHHLLKKVQELVDKTTECGSLYSDIGRVFYTKLGWTDYRSPQVIIHLGDGLKVPESTSGASLLTESDVEALCDRDVESMKLKFQRLAESKDGKTHVTFLPSFVQCSWHFARDAYVLKTLRGRKVQHRGAQTSDGGSWLYWDHDVREDKLKIQRIVLAEGQYEKRVADVKALLEAALTEASAWGLVKVGIWSPSSETCTAATNLWRELGPKMHLVFEERESESIPSLRWKGGNSPGEIVWVDNEYFSWC